MVFEKTLFFNSEPARRNNSSNKAEDFTVEIVPTIILDQNKKYKVGLVSLSAAYSWHNIEAQAGNNLVRYSTDGITFKDVNFADGSYSYSDINNRIHDVMKANGDYTVVLGQDVFDINLSFSLSTYLVSITISGGYEFEIPTIAFGNLIGFDVETIDSDTIGNRLPNITRSLDNILVHCSLVNGSVVNGTPTNTIFQYSTATLRRSYSYQFEPYNISYQNMAGNTIQSVRIYITDVNGNSIDLNNIDTSYTIKIMEA